MKAPHWVVVAFALFGVPVVAHPSEPPFQLVRSDESYRYLRESGSGSWNDTLKYVPLTTDGEAYVSFGGEIRERYDIFDAPRFGIGSKSDSYDLQRILVHADLHLGTRIRVYAEIGNHDVFGKRTAILPVDKDPTDVQNAFIDVNPDASEQWRVRVGRQELLLNPTQRFISVREGPNIRQSYDGVRFTWNSADWHADGFTLRPVIAKPQAFDDRGDPNTRFSGLYVSRHLPQWAGSMDGYWIALDRFGARYGTRTADERRRGIGTHLALKSAGWDIDGDALIQYATFGSATIRAWGAGLDVGRTFEMTGRPRVGLRLDGASGGSLADRTQLSTFNPLFPKGLYFDESTLTTFANLLSVRPSLTVSPIPTVSVQLSESWRWRDSREDALYLIPFVSLPQTLANNARYVGQWTIVDAVWRADRYWTLQAEFVHVRAGDAVTLARGHDVDFEMLVARFQF